VTDKQLLQRQRAEHAAREVRCSVLLCVAACCSAVQCGAVCCSVLQCVAVRCRVNKLSKLRERCVAVHCA